MAAFYTLLYVAPIATAEAIAVDEDAMERYPNAWLKRIGDEELVDLWDIIDAGSNEGTLMGELAFASNDGEVMVMQVPAEFVKAVTAIDPNLVAEQWRSTELMQDWSQADVVTVLQELIQICRLSLEKGHPVLQVACL